MATEMAIQPGCHFNFPCCCDIPLEIAVQILCILDMVYATICLGTWCAFLGMDLLANRKVSASSKSDNGTDDDDDDLFKPPTGYIDIFVDPTLTTTTTEAPDWTLRTTTTEVPFYDYQTEDLEIISKEYSKIALITVKKHDHIERQCGRGYLQQFLFTYELFKTRAVWLEFLWTSIFTELLYLLLALLMLMVVCCFVIHRGAKLLVMVIWFFQWVPMFMNIYAIILSQSKRLCIFEYAWSHRGFKGQTFLKWFILSRILIYKLYEVVLIGMYIKKDLLEHGYLKDEAVVGPQEEPEESKKFFKEFYELENKKSGDLNALMSTDTSMAASYDGLGPIEVDKIQGKRQEMDSYSQRQTDIRMIKASGGASEFQMKSIRKT